MKSWLQQAREESGLTVEQCAVTIHQPVEMYLRIEQRPGTVNLNELRALARTFDEGSRKRVMGALAGIVAGS